jgi:integrase
VESAVRTDRRDRAAPREALGLLWDDDVGFEHGTLTVRRQLVQLSGHHYCPHCGGHNGVMLAEPKTASGARTVELDAHTTGVLLDQRLRQDADRGTWRDAYADHGLVFARGDGNPLPPDRVTKRFAELCDDAEVRRVRLHDLRHGSASLMLAAGVDLALVSKILGHSQIAITADTYSHLLEGVGRDAAERASALVPRAPRGWSETLGLPSGS